MSMPNIPDFNPKVDISRDDAINILLASIGMEELSLAHIINAEAEKIQFSLGTLDTSNGQASSIDTIMEVNKMANKMLRDVIKNQMLLSMKMEDILEMSHRPTTTTLSTTSTNSTTTQSPCPSHSHCF